jgi:outer membrane cobalamin receptor
MLLLLAAACAGRPRASERDRNIIRADEIAQVQVQTAYDVVARLRSEFLKTRGTVTRAPGRTTDRMITTEQPKVTVFLDGVEAGPVEQTLYLIPASEVFEIRLYRAADAVTKYGSRHTGGVIAVTTKRVDR